MLYEELGLGALNARKRCRSYLVEDPSVVARREKLWAKKERLEDVYQARVTLGCARSPRECSEAESAQYRYGSLVPAVFGCIQSLKSRYKHQDPYPCASSGGEVARLWQRR